MSGDRKLLVRRRVPDEIDRNDDLDLVRIHFVDLDDETLGLPGLVEDDDIRLAELLVLLVVDLYVLSVVGAQPAARRYGCVGRARDQNSQ